jgi:hypothetical protein
MRGRYRRSPGNATTGQNLLWQIQSNAGKSIKIATTTLRASKREPFWECEVLLRERGQLGERPAFGEK